MLFANDKLLHQGRETEERFMELEKGHIMQIQHLDNELIICRQIVEQMEVLIHKKGYESNNLTNPEMMGRINVLKSTVHRLNTELADKIKDNKYLASQVTFFL